MAEMIFRHKTRNRPLDHVSVASAGLFAYPGNPPDPEMVTYLEYLGMTGIEHGARQISNEDAQWADLILVMERSHADVMEAHWPEWKDKVVLLGRYLAEDGRPLDIIDPYGLSPEYYRIVQEQIEKAVQRLIQDIEALKTERQNDQA